MTLTVHEVNSDLNYVVKCKNCGERMNIKDVFVTGDCMICPKCGEIECFEEVKE